MSLRACIPGMVARDEISQGKADEMAGLYDALEQDFRRQFGDQAAASMASDATLRAMKADALRKKRLMLGQRQAQKGALLAMDGYNGGRAPGAPIDPRAAVALFDRDGRAGYSNVEGRRRAVRGRAHAMIDGILARHHTNIVGNTRFKADLADLVREAFGEDSGNANARELARAWADAAEMLRQRFNAAGGAIAKLKDWGLPQSHDTMAVRRAGYEAWRDTIAPLLDRDRMIDRTSGLPMSNAQLELALRDVFETIRTDGWNKRNPGAPGRGSMANRRQDHRFLIFKSADDWMAYQEKFGAGTAFDAMMGHIDHMSRDIAAMEILGPNPAATVKWLKDTIEKSAATAIDPGSKAQERAFAATKQIDRLWDEISGNAGRPESRTMALAFSSIRSVETAAKLGSAFLSALPTDPAFGMVARRYAGLPVARMLGTYIKLFKPGAEADQRLAVRLGLIAEEWSKRAAGQHRFLGEELTGEVSRRLAEGVLRVSGLERFTSAGRWAFGMEFLGHITDQADKTFAALDPGFRRTLQRHGIGADGWDAIRSTPTERDGGADWIKPANIADRALGDRVLEMIQSETYYAVPEPDLRTKALFNSITPKGTFVGEIVRSALLFKGFGVTATMMQARRIIEAASAGKWSAGRYAAGLVLATTAGGALALQLKALAGGRDPRPMDDRKFWGAALLQGGGFGIFGDFLQSQQNRFGGGISATLAGPLAEDVQTAMTAVQSKHPAWATARMARQWLPGGSLWFARLAFDREMTDQVQQQLDPNYRQSWRRMRRYADKQRTDYWWAPGTTVPQRAPDLSNAYRTDHGGTP